MRLTDLMGSAGVICSTGVIFSLCFTLLAIMAQDVSVKFFFFLSLSLFSKIQ